MLIKADCFEVLPRVKKRKFDLIFLDMPYGVNLQGNGVQRPEPERADYLGTVNQEWDKIEDWESYFDKLLKLLIPLLAEKGSIWVCGTYHNIHTAGYLARKNNLFTINEVIWEKSNPVPNFKGVRLTAAHETLLWLCKDKKYTFNYQDAKIFNEGKQLRDVWKINICGGNERLKNADGNTLHPTQKPIELLNRIITICTKEQAWVLDPFAGTGTTLVAAKNLNRHYLGIENNIDFYKAASQRIGDLF